MSDLRPPPLEPASPARNRTRSRLVAILVAGAVGGIVGAFLARGGSAHGKPALPLASPMKICLAAWVMLSLYWVWAERSASAARAAESGASRALHVTMLNAAMLLSFWPYPGWLIDSPPWSFPRVLPEWPWLAPLGVAVQIGCLLLAIWARRALGRHWSGEVTLKVDHELIRTGPYRRIRHPIYTGAIGMHLGPALVSGRLQGVLALVLIGIAYARKIRQEERVLSAEFGPAWDEYRRASWALIPRVL